MDYPKIDRPIVEGFYWGTRGGYWYLFDVVDSLGTLDAFDVRDNTFSPFRLSDIADWRGPIPEPTEP